MMSEVGHMPPRRYFKVALFGAVVSMQSDKESPTATKHMGCKAGALGRGAGNEALSFCQKICHFEQTIYHFC